MEMVFLCMRGKAVLMKRVVIKCKDGQYINVAGDFFRLDEDFLLAWNGENLVAIVRVELIESAHISEK